MMICVVLVLGISTSWPLGIYDNVIQQNSFCQKILHTFGKLPNDPLIFCEHLTFI